MNTSTPRAKLSDNESDNSACYTLEILSNITGISTQTILHYQEHGIIRPSGAHYDDETIRSLHRIDYLRDTCELNLNGLKLLTALLGEVEHLRAELRERR